MGCLECSPKRRLEQDSITSGNKSQTDNLPLHLGQLEKEEQTTQLEEEMRS